MNRYLATLPTARILRPTNARRIGALCGAVLAVCLVAAGMWWVGGEVHTGRTGLVSRSASTDAVAETSVPVVPAIRIETPTVYLVDPQQDLEFARRLIADLNALGSGGSQGPLEAIVAVDSSVAADALPRAPGTAFIDLRTRRP